MGARACVALLLVLASARAVRQARRCDVFTINGTELCAPSLFLIGMGKCGTNAFRTYTSLHPLVRWPGLGGGEVKFDPRSCSTEQLMRWNPGVTPKSNASWFVKFPYHVDEGLVHAIRTTYPSAAVALVMCNSERRPWSWLRHVATRTLTLNGLDANPKALLAASSQWGVHSAADLYRQLFRFDNLSACNQGLLSNLTSMGFKFANMHNLDCPDGHARMEGLDPPHVRYVQAMTKYYKLNSSMAVIVMEDWEDRGPEILKNIFKVAHLPPLRGSQIPVVRFSRKVFAASQDVFEDSEIPIEEALRLASAKLCLPLEHLLGRTLPWPACAEMGSIP